MTMNRRAEVGTEKRGSRPPLYTPEQRLKRDTSPWTLVQGILAPLQLLVFLVSVSLILSYLLTGQGLFVSEASVVVKTLALYTIMITGAAWEKAVFGRYLFAPAFFWEDVLSMAVLGLHTLYLGLLTFTRCAPILLMGVALAGYATYVINATQFILKLRAGHLESPARKAGGRLAEAMA